MLCLYDLIIPNTCFRIGCHNKPEEIVIYPTDKYHTKNVVFCKSCYKQLVKDAIIEGHEVKFYHLAYG